MAATIRQSAVTGLLTKDGRLTRGGLWFMRGFGLLLLAGVVGEGRALLTVAMAERTSGTVVESTEVPTGSRAYRVRVTFTADGRPAQVERTLRHPRSRRQLLVGEQVIVAFWPDAFEKAVLVHRDENWTGAPWVFVLGAALVAMSWYWAPLRVEVPTQ